MKSLAIDEVVIPPRGDRKALPGIADLPLGSSSEFPLPARFFSPGFRPLGFRSGSSPRFHPPEALPPRSSPWVHPLDPLPGSPSWVLHCVSTLCSPPWVPPPRFHPDSPSPPWILPLGAPPDGLPPVLPPWHQYVCVYAFPSPLGKANTHPTCHKPAGPGTKLPPTWHQIVTR